MFRKDRPTPGGGVLAYVPSFNPAICIDYFEADDKEILYLITSHTTSDSNTFQLHN